MHKPYTLTHTLYTLQLALALCLASHPTPIYASTETPSTQTQPQTQTTSPTNPQLTTLQAVVENIIANMSETDQQTVRQTPYNDLIQYHFGWGANIRNHYGLWDNTSPLLNNICQNTPCHPDDASMIIIENVWTALQTPESLSQHNK